MYPQAYPANSPYGHEQIQNSAAFQGPILGTAVVQPQAPVPMHTQPVYSAASVSFGLNQQGQVTLGNYPVPIENVAYDANFSNTGIVSHDPALNQNATTLYNFLLSNCTKPILKLVIHGYYYDSHGHGRNGHSEKVTDFSFQFNLSDFILNDGLLNHVPSNEKEPQMTINQLAEAFVSSTEKLKEINLEKIVEWDFDGLKQVITEAIRSNGYQNHLDIMLINENSSVKIYGNSNLAVCANNCCVRALCVVSCLWIIAYPAFLLMKGKSEFTLNADYRIAISPLDWFNLHRQTILERAFSVGTGLPLNVTRLYFRNSLLVFAICALIQSRSNATLVLVLLSVVTLLFKVPTGTSLTKTFESILEIVS